MLLELVLFFTMAAAITTATVMVPGGPAPTASPELIGRGGRWHAGPHAQERLHPAAFFHELARVAADQNATHPGSPDRRRVAADRPAVFLELRALDAIHLGTGGMAIPLVGLASDDAEQPDFAVTPDQEGRRGLLHRPRVRHRAAKGVVPTLDIDRSAAP